VQIFVDVAALCCLSDGIVLALIKLSPSFSGLNRQGEIFMWQQWNFFRTRESKLIESLRSLTDEYVVLHDLIVPESRTQIDHVVVGPNGVFAIEINDCAGDVKCEGRDWSVGRRRVASLGRQAAIKAAALRKSLVSVTYEGEKKIPCITPVLVFTNSEARVSVRAPAMPAMRTEELSAFILHYKVAEIPEEERAALVRHLASFQSREAGRRGFLGLRIGRASASRSFAARSGRRIRPGLKIASKSLADDHRAGRHNTDRFPDFSGSN
jgi:nuclease-like protein